VNDGFSAFKAMAIGLGAILLVTTVAPDVASGQFDTLRLSKGKRGKSTSGTGTGTGTTTGTDTGTSVGTGTSTGSTGSTTNSFYSEDSLIASNFDINTELVTAPLPGTAAPDVLGAFRFICTAGQLLRDDPIVYPGQPGKSHLHQFYGNLGASANSTYSSLRASGQSTCMSPLNRSAYWMPAMLDGKGNVVRPDYVTIYYKRRPITDPKCSLTSGDPRAEGNCVPLPNGLRFIFGFDMLTSTEATGAMHYTCTGTGATQGSYKSLAEAKAFCPAGSRIGAVIQAPACWDGKNLDSPNHRDHVSYASYGNWGYKRCPTTHPYVIPTFTLGAYYSIAAGDDLSLWSLSSDEMRPELPKGSTFHADWFGAWDNTVMSMWIDNCINKLLSCSSGNLGNGKMMKQSAGFSWTASPRLVPAA
jgi:hypothetical protein